MLERPSVGCHLGRGRQKMCCSCENKVPSKGDGVVRSMYRRANSASDFRRWNDAGRKIRQESSSNSFKIRQQNVRRNIHYEDRTEIAFLFPSTKTTKLRLIESSISYG